LLPATGAGDARRHSELFANARFGLEVVELGVEAVIDRRPRAPPPAERIDPKLAPSPS